VDVKTKFDMACPNAHACATCPNTRKYTCKFYLKHTCKFVFNVYHVNLYLMFMTMNPEASVLCVFCIFIHALPLLFLCSTTAPARTEEATLPRTTSLLQDTPRQVAWERSFESIIPLCCFLSSCLVSERDSIQYYMLALSVGFTRITALLIKGRVHAQYRSTHFGFTHIAHVRACLQHLWTSKRSGACKRMRANTRLSVCEASTVTTIQTYERLLINCWVIYI
jgi:hypothetical protein